MGLTVDGAEGALRLLTAARGLKDQRIFETTQFGTIADRLADRFGTQGLPITLSTACASGATAIQLGVEAIRRGEAERARRHRHRRLGHRRGADPLLAAVGAVDQQRGAGEGLQAVLARPRRLRYGRRLGGAGAGEPDERQSARRRDARHPARLRRAGRRLPPHALQARRRRRRSLPSSRRSPMPGSPRTRSTTSTRTARRRRRTTRWSICRCRPCSASACARSRSPPTSR